MVKRGIAGLGVITVLALVLCSGCMGDVPPPDAIIVRDEPNYQENITVENNKTHVERVYYARLHSDPLQ